MLALALTNKKDFMNKFLKTEIFDHFLLQEGIVVSFASYVIDGTITKGFYTDTEAEELGIKTFHFLPFSTDRTWGRDPASEVKRSAEDDR